MSRFSIIVLLIAAAACIIAEGCENCTCGQECDGTACADGCMVFDQFVAAGATQTVYGRECECSNDSDEKGRIVKCEDGTDFVNQPAGDSWTQNPNC